jgi:hypothetical protein
VSLQNVFPAILWSAFMSINIYSIFRKNDYLQSEHKLKIGEQKFFRYVVFKSFPTTYLLCSKLKYPRRSYFQHPVGFHSKQWKWWVRKCWFLSNFSVFFKKQKFFLERQRLCKYVLRGEVFLSLLVVFFTSIKALFVFNINEHLHNEHKPKFNKKIYFVIYDPRAFQRGTGRCQGVNTGWEKVPMYLRVYVLMLTKNLEKWKMKNILIFDYTFL